MEDTSNKFQIELRDENFQAWLKIFDPTGITIVDIAESLKRFGVSQGIKGDFIRKLASNGFPFGQYLIAEGIQPINGEDARIELLVNLKPPLTPIEITDENNKYFPIYINNVIEGQNIVKYIPASKGTPGLTVLGKEIPAMPGRPCPSPKGMNTDLSETNPNFLIAKRSGNFLWDGQKARVETEYTVGGDISLVNGDVVEFVGDLKVAGDIKIGVTVKVGGNLSVFGTVEDGIIECEGNVAIKGGVFGSGRGRLVAGGSIDVNHLYNLTLRSGGEVTIKREAMNCQIYAKSIISRHAAIFGGTIVAQNFIEVNDLGREQYAKTTVIIGGKNQMSDIILGIEREIASIDEKMKENKESIFRLAKDKLTNNNFNEEKELKLQKMRTDMDLMSKNTATLKEKRTRLITELKQLVPKLVVNGTIHENVHLTINDTSMLVNDPLSNVTMYEKNKEIVKIKNVNF
jgi:uncharacterized protein